MTKTKKVTKRRKGQSASKALLGDLPEPSLWMTHESMRNLANGGNSKGAVPVHGKRSATAKIPLYTEEQIQSERIRCFNMAITTT